LEAGKEELKKSIQSLWEMVKRYAELAEKPTKEEDNFIRWRQERYKVAEVARIAGLMDKETFGMECGLRTETLAWAMGIVDFPSKPPKTDDSA
jgi:tryptophan 2,3-dioxygenase